MKLAIRKLRDTDDISQIFDMCRENDLTTPNYTTSQSVWNFQYVNNPHGFAWNSIIIDEESNNILGHCGLIPFFLRTNSGNILGGLISNGVVSEQARNKLLPYNDSKTFSVIPLLDNCCLSSFEGGGGIIFAFSSVPPFIWKVLGFDNLSLEVRVTCHSSLKNLYRNYVRQLRQSISSGLKRLLIKPYAFVLTLLQALVNKVQDLKAPSSYDHQANIDIELFEEFDESFNTLLAEFMDENSQIITYCRDMAHLNWLFRNDRYKKFKFIIDDRLVGYCIILADDRNCGCMCDFIILREYLLYVPGILRRLTFKKKLSFNFTQYLSCTYSHKLYEQCVRTHSCSFPTWQEIVRKAVKTSTESQFYYRVNRDLPLIEKNKEIFVDETNWFINPLFYGPKYFG